jgi:hypothetical protein
MEDLMRVMDLNRGSLYDTFGDTRHLFLKVMNRTAINTSASILVARSTGPALPTLRRFIHRMIGGGLADPQRRGCLIANAVMELSPHEQEIAGTLKGPYPHGDHFILPFKYSVTPKHRGEGMIMDETGHFAIQNGTITKDKFFYSMYAQRLDSIDLDQTTC